jgi:hypothetical protein
MGQLTLELIEMQQPCDFKSSQIFNFRRNRSCQLICVHSQSCQVCHQLPYQYDKRASQGHFLDREAKEPHQAVYLRGDSARHLIAPKTQV